MKRTPLKRKTPLKAKKQRSFNSTLPVRTDKRRAEEAQYHKQRKAYLVAHPRCEIWVTRDCHQSRSTQIHHKRGRRGAWLLDESEWLACCSPCHEWVERNFKKAVELGFMHPRRNQ